MNAQLTLYIAAVIVLLLGAVLDHPKIERDPLPCAGFGTNSYRSNHSLEKRETETNKGVE